jgi:hypothetical protein
MNTVNPIYYCSTQQALTSSQGQHQPTYFGTVAQDLPWGRHYVAIFKTPPDPASPIATPAGWLVKSISWEEVLELGREPVDPWKEITAADFEDLFKKYISPPDWETMENTGSSKIM